VEILTRQPLKRVEEAGFEAEHRVPATGKDGSVIKKTVKVLAPKAAERAAKRRFYR
jgi:hypothetical protein